MQIFPNCTVLTSLCCHHYYIQSLPYVNGALCWMHGYLFTGKYSSHR